MKASIAVYLAIFIAIFLALRVGAEPPAEASPTSARSVETPERAPAPVAAVPAAAKSLIGAWKNVDDPERVIRFEAAKYSSARIGGGPRIVRADYGPGKIITHSWGKTTEYTFAWKDEVLSISRPDGTTKSYRKLAEMPAELEPKAMKLGEAGELGAERVQSIQEELARRAKVDQQVRRGAVKPEEMEKVDSDNTKSLVKLVGEIGWIDAERFGAKASNNAFLIVQHSGDMALMLAALPWIEKDVKAKRLDVQPYALLYDRLQIMLGEKQRYGTQVGSDEKGEMILLSLVDRKRVEEIRKEVGLFPLADYIKIFEENNDGRRVVFEDDR